MLFYPAALPLSSRTVVFTAGDIRRHRVRIGAPWRKLNPTEQELLVLAYLRKGETFADLASGFGIGTATAWRYVTETVALLAARSPKLRTALGKPESQKDANRAHARLRGVGERANAPAQDVAHPAETTLLPLACRPSRQGHPRSSGPRDRRMKGSVPT